MSMRLSVPSIRGGLLLPLTLAALFVAGCVQGANVSVEGVLRDIDCADGKLTVVTDEGKTFVMTISTPDCQARNVQAGQRVRVDTDSEQKTVQNITVVQKTEVHQTTIVGKVVSVDNDQVTVQKDNGEKVKVQVKPNTNVKLEGGRQGKAQDLTQNVTVVVNIDQQTNVAQTVTVQGGATPPNLQASPTPTRQAPSTPTPTLPPATPTSAPTSMPSPTY